MKTSVANGFLRPDVERVRAIDDEYHADRLAGIGALDVSSALIVWQLQILFITAQVEQGSTPARRFSGFGKHTFWITNFPGDECIPNRRVK
jgi:hypothetical protein